MEAKMPADRESQSSVPSHGQVICTLIEGDYHLGLAALINSIVRGGFRGLFWIGYRGSLPPWTAQLNRCEDGLFKVGDALLGFEEQKTQIHFGQYKSEFLSSIVDRGITTKSLWYFDPDITVMCDWNFFEKWVRHGVCLCQDDGYGFMPARHPLRCAWIELAREAGWGEPKNLLNQYFNSGFVGLDIGNRALLERWLAAVRLARANGVKPDQFQKGSRTQTFYTVDQDAMNMAAMYSDVPLSPMGPEGMNFFHGGFVMHHSITSPKPWRKDFLRAWFRGAPPTKAELHFLQCLDGPVYPYSSRELKKMRRSAAIASRLGRFYRWV
jgi:hypothetical protein